MKRPNIRQTIKRSVAASLLNYSIRTLRRKEQAGELTPIHRSSRSVFYFTDEVEKLQRGETSTPFNGTMHTAPARAAGGQFAKGVG
jgi:hypothetical protein